MGYKPTRKWVTMEELTQIKRKEMGIGADMVDYYMEKMPDLTTKQKAKIMSEIRTSKIKSVDEVSSPYGQYQTLYHNLTMENGDKINIGKKKQQQAGWELIYTIEGDPTQHTYVKAKSVKKEDAPQQGVGQQNQPNNQQFKQDPDKARSIEMQVCLKEAVQHHSMHGFKSGEKDEHILEVCTTAQTFYGQLFGKDA